MIFCLYRRQRQERLTQLNRLLKVFSDLGLPLALEKLEGPSPRVAFLGIEIDSIAMELRHPGFGAQRLDKGLSGEEVVPEEGAAVIGWETAACLQGGEAWLIFPESYVQIASWCVQGPSPHQVEHLLPLGHWSGGILFCRHGTENLSFGARLTMRSRMLACFQMHRVALARSLVGSSLVSICMA